MEPVPVTRKRVVVRLPVLDVTGIKASTKLPIRQSTVKAYEKCPTYGLLSVRCGLRPNQRSAALDRGTFTHAALRRLLTFKSTPDDKERVAKKKTTFRALRINNAWSLLGVMFANVIEHHIKSQPNKVPNPEFHNKLVIDMNVGMACAVKLYDELRPLIKNGSLTVLAAEFSFDENVLFGNEFVRLAGRIDLAFRTDKGKVFLWDTKTADAPPDEVALVYNYGIQPFEYTLGVRNSKDALKLLGCKPSDIVGFLHGIVQKPTCIRKGMTKGPTKQQPLDDYLDECDEWWAGVKRWSKNALKRKASPPVYVHRQFIGPTIDDVPPGIVIRIMDTKRHLELEPNLADHPQHDGQCRQGNFTCSMLKLCSRPHNQWRRIIERDYTVGTDPLTDEGL